MTKTEYDRLLQDLRALAKEMNASELDRLVDEAQDAMALEFEAEIDNAETTPTHDYHYSNERIRAKREF